MLYFLHWFNSSYTFNGYDTYFLHFFIFFIYLEKYKLTIWFILEDNETLEDSLSSISNSSDESDFYESLLKTPTVSKPSGTQMPSLDSDDDDDQTLILRTKNEAEEETIDLNIPLNIESDELLELAGHFLHIADKQSLVFKVDRTDTILPLYTLLCLEDRTVIGRIIEVIGPIKSPYYLVRIPTLQTKSKDSNITVPISSSESAPAVEENQNQTSNNSTDTMTENQSTLSEEPSELFTEQRYKSLMKRLVPGTQVFNPTKSITRVDPKTLHVPGYDASDMNDEELPPEKQEFSDDEQERQAKLSRKSNRSKTRKTPQLDYTIRESEMSVHPTTESPISTVIPPKVSRQYDPFAEIDFTPKKTPMETTMTTVDSSQQLNEKSPQNDNRMEVDNIPQTDGKGLSIKYSKPDIIEWKVLYY